MQNTTAYSPGGAKCTRMGDHHIGARPIVSSLHMLFGWQSSSHSIVFFFIYILQLIVIHKDTANMHQ